MRASFDITGTQITSMREYDIASATAVAEGQLVKLSAGLVVLATAGETGAILGVAAEAHSGVADTTNPRSNGTRIKVYDSPTLVHEHSAPQITTTSGSTTTVVATGIATFADDDFNGGYLKLISKAASSTNTDPVGTVYSITDFTASTKTFTTPTAGGSPVAGDVYEVYPPIGFAKGNLDAGIAKYVLSATASLAIKVVNMDLARGMVQTMAALHQFGNKQS